MTPTELLSMVLLLVGSTMVLAELPWFRRQTLVERLLPYTRAAGPRPPSRSAGAGIRQVIAPGLEDLGARASRALGLRDDLQLRLERCGSPDDAATFRVRQVAHGVISLLVAGALALVLRPPAPLAIMLVLGAPVMAILLHEQYLSTKWTNRSARLVGELPVIVEQLGMLMSAGYSLTSAINRLAVRSDGEVARDLRRVIRRIRQGLSASDALTEWADRSDIDAIRRLVAVLHLHSDAGDLGALIAEEARAIRSEAHRDLLESIERRAQLVWIPVTVATLVPGLIFLAVPFMSAMAQVTGGG